MSYENSVGVLPNCWFAQSLSIAADVVMGQSPPGASYNEDGVGAPFFQGKAEFGQMHPTVKKWTTAGNKHAKVGDILLSVRAPVGPTNVADIDCVIGRGLAAIRAKNHMNQVFLLWFLRSFEHEIAAKGTGTTFDSISGDALRNQLINVPPLEEQEKIVEILEEQLSRLDAALASVRAVREKAAKFRRSLLHAAFTGVLSGHDASLGVLPEGWEESTMGEIGRYLNGFAFSSKTWSRVGRPIIRIQNLTGSGSDYNYFDGEIDDRYVVREGDLLFSWAATLGVYIWRGPEAVLNQHIFKVESNIDKSFHRALIEHKTAEMMQQTHGTGMVHITKKKFDAIPILKPPAKEQEKIVEILDEQLSRLDAVLAIADSTENKVTDLRRSLLHAAFTGELTKEWREDAHV
jgi:type I restriction enzyme S subunit